MHRQVLVGIVGPQLDSGSYLRKLLRACRLFRLVELDDDGSEFNLPSALGRSEDDDGQLHGGVHVCPAPIDDDVGVREEKKRGRSARRTFRIHGRSRLK